MIGGRTRVFALLGNPVGHSLSPVMHNAGFRALGLDAVYIPLQVGAAELAPLMKVLAEAGGGGNVTVPHKRLAAGIVRSDRQPQASTCNTFWGDGASIVGTSTDVDGLVRAWTELGRPAGDWLLVGTGGSAVAAALAAATVGAGVLVRARAQGRARAFESEVSALGVTLGSGGPIGLAVNCTPLGMTAADPLPLAVDRLPAGSAVLDLVYRPGETAWVKAARQAGHRAIDGRTVLLGQGAASFQCWFPKLSAPIDIMAAALDRALR